MEASRRMRIYQQDAYISVDYVSSRLKIYTKKTPVVNSLRDIDIAYPKFAPKQPIKEELMHFIDCIKTAKTPTPSGEKGLKALRLALDITNQMRRYEVSGSKSEGSPESLAGTLADIGKATKMVVEEGLKNAGIERT
jgi:predicted dehydrogenase